MANSVQDVMRECTELLKSGLRPYIEENLRAVYSSDWESRASCAFDAGVPHWDLQSLLRTMLDNWPAVFEQALPRNARGLLFELKDWRNRVAHEHSLTLDDAYRFVDTAERFLKLVASSELAAIAELKSDVRRALVISDFPSVATSHTAGSTGSTTAKRAGNDEQDAHEVKAPSVEPAKPGRQKHEAGAPSWQPCVDRIGSRLGTNLSRKKGRCAMSSDGNIGVCCVVSKKHGVGRFWWNVRESQLNVLANVNAGYLAFACGTPDSILLIPVRDFAVWLPTFNPKKGDDGEGWHIHILHEGTRWWLLQTGRNNRVDITRYST